MTQEMNMAEIVNGEVVATSKPEPTEALAAPLEYRLGRIGQHDPKKVVAEATEMANALAEVITTQKLYTVIKQKKYVHFEGWATLGGMMGIVPLEEHVREVEKGYEAKIKLVRIRDGVTVGSASSICTRNESLWADREEYAVRSMAITRATSKAYRMSYSWIIKLAGFEATPIEEAAQIAQVEALAAYQQREAEQMPTPDQQQKEIAERKISDAMRIQMVEWKEGLLALQGHGVPILQSRMTPAERTAIGIKFSDADKANYIKAADGFMFSDLCKKYGIECEFATI
jgi:hypothetical protein